MKHKLYLNHTEFSTEHSAASSGMWEARWLALRQKERGGAHFGGRQKNGKRVREKLWKSKQSAAETVFDRVGGVKLLKPHGFFPLQSSSFDIKFPRLRFGNEAGFGKVSSERFISSSPPLACGLDVSDAFKHRAAGCRCCFVHNTENLGLARSLLDFMWFKIYFSHFLLSFPFVTLIMGYFNSSINISPLFTFEKDIWYLRLLNPFESYTLC